MSELTNLFAIDDATLRDMAEVEEDTEVKGKYFLELAHRTMPGGGEARIDYEIWLKKAIECGNEEAREEYAEFCSRRENSREKSDAAIRERIQEIRNMTQAETSELARKGEIAAIYVFCERVVSRKRVTTPDLDNIAWKMRKMSDQMSRNPENVVPYDLMGALYYKIGSMYENQKEYDKAVINYGNATEYGNLDAMRILRSGELGNENCDKYAEIAASIGNAEDKFVNLKTKLTNGEYEEADTIIVDMLKAEGRTLDDLYRWAGEVLKYDYTDGASTIYEYIVDTADEDTPCLGLASWMYNALNGTEPDELWEIALMLCRKEKESFSEALSMYLDFSLKQNDDDGKGIRVFPKEITPNGIDAWICNTQLTNGIPDGSCEIRSYKALALRDIMPDNAADTFGSHAFLWRAEAEISGREIRNVSGMRDDQGEEVEPCLADCYLRRGLRYTDDRGSFIMKLDEPETFLKCTVKGIKDNEGNTIAEECIVYEGGIQDTLEQGKGIRYSFSDIGTDLLSPVHLLKERGTMLFDEKYEGDFRQGLYWGYGKQEKKDGRCWEGTFVNGNAEGVVRWVSGDQKTSGIFTFREGKTMDGCRLTLSGTNTDGSKRGNVYKGEFHNAPKGQGVYLEFNSLPEEQANIEYVSAHFEEIQYTRKQAGTFKGKYALDGEGEKTEQRNGALHGQWKGFFTNGKLEGDGQLKLRGGAFIKGQWTGGEIVHGVELLPDQRGEWDLVYGDFRGHVVWGQGEDYHFDVLPETVSCENIDMINPEELPFVWHFSGEIKCSRPKGYGKIIFREDHDAVRYEGMLQLTDNGRFVAISVNHSWKEMDAFFRGINGKGCRLDVMNLYEDDNTADGYYYTGELADSVREGEGSYYKFIGKSFDNITYDALNGKDPEQLGYDEKYTGQFVNGKPSGLGKLTVNMENNQDWYWEYYGHFTDGEEDGEGCVFNWTEDSTEGTATGEAYLGEFRNGVMTGKGKMKKFSNLSYEKADAEYIREHFDELFCVKYSEGIVSGFMNLDGNGSTTVRDGNLIWVRTGEFSKNQINGEGKCCLYKGETMAEGDQYLNDLSAFCPVWCFEGTLREGKPYDSGRLTIPAASEWYLPLKNCIRGGDEGNSPVTLKLEGFSGELDEKCRLAKPVKLVMPNGDTYIGETDSFLRPDGKGTMVYVQPGEELSYSGAFREGRRHGTGKLMNGKKTVYEGEWRDNHIVGKIHLTQKRYKDFL